MWIYSFITSQLSSLLPLPGEPTPYPPPPSESNPTPYQFPVLAPTSTEHNPYSYHESRPVGTYAKKKTKEMKAEEEAELARRLKEKRNPTKPGQEPINVPITAPFKRELAPLPDAVETPLKVVRGYLANEVEMLCSESDWQLNECTRKGSSFTLAVCLDERKRKHNCRLFHRAFLASMGYGRRDMTPQQDVLTSRLADIAWQERVRDGRATDKDNLGLPMEE